jgi:hypothetical protein
LGIAGVRALFSPDCVSREEALGMTLPPARRYFLI